MSRGYHADSVAELETDSQYLFHLIEFEFDSGTQRFTDAARNIDFSGNTFFANSRFKDFGDVTESQKLELNSMQFKVSAVELTAVATALSESTINRKINLYQGLLDTSDHTVIADPLLIYSGRIKSFEVRETPGDKAVLIWNTASILGDFERTVGRRSNHQDQESYLDFRNIAGGDKGFEYAHQITPDLAWGRP